MLGNSDRHNQMIWLRPLADFWGKGSSSRYLGLQKQDTWLVSRKRKMVVTKRLSLLICDNGPLNSYVAIYRINVLRTWNPHNQIEFLSAFTTCKQFAHQDHSRKIKYGNFTRKPVTARARKTPQEQSPRVSQPRKDYRANSARQIPSISTHKCHLQ